MAMKRILSLCDKYGLVKPIRYGPDIDYLKFGPVGAFLVGNVKQEWHLSNVINREENVFPIHSFTPSLESANKDLLEAYMHVRGLCNGILPFGISQTIVNCGVSNREINDPPQPHATFSPSQKTYQRSILFVTQVEGRQKFYTWQQKRKMWWRKFSSHPGRFSLSDIQESSSGNGSHTNELKVNILAEFDWGPTVIESIHLSSLNSLGVTEDQLEALKVKDGRKQVVPSIVECIMSVDIASFAFLCDAYCDSSKKQLLRLHRRLAPFKAGFMLNISDASLTDRLLEVAKHLSRTMRQDGLSTLLLPDISKKSQDLQLTRNDEMGIPFTIALSDSTVTDGIIHLYSRETTLMEQVHLSKLPEYMKQLVKNY